MDDDDRERFAVGLRHACMHRSGAALDLGLHELGWNEALAEDRRTAVSLLFEVRGETGAGAPPLGAVLGAALGVTIPPGAGFVLPPLGGDRTPGEGAGGGLAVRGVGAGSLVDSTTALVVTRTGDVDRVAAVATSELTFRPVHGMDPDLGLVEVAGDGVPIAAPGGRDLDPGAWPAATALARLAVAHELVGGARAMLALACDHARQRIQFGRPISAFQAVRHRLAETLVAIEAADAALDSAWRDGSAQSAAIAKAVAGRSAGTTARHCQQVLAGIGFTTEHSLHRHVRRTLVLDQLFGAARTLTDDLGAEVLATRRLPALPLL